MSIISEQELINWLAREDSSAFGECRGETLDRLIAKRFAQVEWMPGKHADYGRVSLTEAGRRWVQPLNPILDEFKCSPDAPTGEQNVCKIFRDVALHFQINLPDTPERSVGLRKLVEAKVCMVRAAREGKN